MNYLPRNDPFATVLADAGPLFLASVRSGRGSSTRSSGNSSGGSTGVITVALIEDNRLMREGITALLGRVPDVDVVWSRSSAGIAELSEADADVVLLDVGLENGDSLDVARQVSQEHAGSRVVVMDLLPVQEEIRDFVRAGVYGFILKDSTPDELVNTIRSVAEGDRVLPSRMTDTLFTQIANDAVSGNGSAANEDVRMTPREREVVGLISDGASNKKIASALDISPHTVKSHVRNIMDKLALHTRLQIAAWAHEEDEDF